MIQMTHHDDGKKKCQSHTIGFRDIENTASEYAKTTVFENAFICGHDITTIEAYGETQEEAIKNLEPVMDWLFEEFEAIRKLYESGLYEQDIQEVDCFGKPI